MADDTTAQQSDTTQQPETVQQVVMLDPVSQMQKAISQAAAQAERNQLDETVEGGAYLVNGAWVNAEGKPVKAPKGK